MTDLKTIVSSKRNDPRMGEQTFRLTNIVRAEPDPSLFAVPSDSRLSMAARRPSSIGGANRQPSSSVYYGARPASTRVPFATSFCQCAALCIRPRIL